MGRRGTLRGALVDREGGQKRRQGIMAQLLNRLRAEERIAGVEFWHSPERCGWLMKQGEYIKTWRRRWFILKQGKIFWFKTEEVGPVSWDQRPPSLVARLVPLCSRFPRSQTSIPRGVVDISRCLSIKGAEDVINKAHAFELSTNTETMFFIADSDKEKEEWISSVGRAIVRQSKIMTDDYGSY